ncbi:putative Ntn-hydrolase superfamily protein [Anseongella ginsenosidimutans]|uniref:Putative Ntn-hydrolase superfamily protein n=2 Tax=Anseongella ginsenosidimutans TaxID=496056 RepID=A0A4R3KV88_9SPHI|nr:DUF1028 domain-containing protein [Anseongella ginsenosidimutans]QEC51856.1 DUF1028 domain-containing protein [Anseongella ginsenosidimutans]TCS89235.1 putative Ntn-hydrolase superfamily protein [Anseongella ginsenosidimutans]
MKTSALIGILALCGFNAFATWSIIIIDPETKEIGIAGASCSYNCYGIGSIMPGKGAIIVQAMSNNEAREEGLKMIITGATPKQIIAAIRNRKFDPERQQYSVLTVSHMNAATYTGTSTHSSNGALTAPGISVQGNTLAGKQVLQAVFAAALKARNEGLRIDKVLMRALEAGSIAGGDKRCGEQKATSAFITVTKPNDHPKRPYLDLVIFGQKKGGPNAVLMLRRKYDKWAEKER